MLSKDNTSVEVVVTKNSKFNTIIQEVGECVYTVILGSKEWKEGKGRKYEEEIYKQVVRIVGKLLEEMDKI